MPVTEENWWSYDIGPIYAHTQIDKNDQIHNLAKKVTI